MWISKNRYEQLVVKENAYYVRSNRFSTSYTQQQFLISYLESEVARLKNENEAFRLVVKEKDESRKNDFANKCFETASRMLEDGKISDSELAMRLYEQYK